MKLDQMLSCQAVGFQEGAHMPSERADHTIVNYKDDTPGAVDDVFAVPWSLDYVFRWEVADKSNKLKT